MIGFDVRKPTIAEGAAEGCCTASDGKFVVAMTLLVLAVRLRTAASSLCMQCGSVFAFLALVKGGDCVLSDFGGWEFAGAYTVG
jgi:hypothetical protein